MAFSLSLSARCATWVVAVAACAHAGAAWCADQAAPAAAVRPAATAQDADADADAARDEAPGNVAALMQMLRDGKVVEMRTTYNGSYGASLTYDAREMTYYVALFQNKQMWRVVKSQDKARAESVYANFVQQTVQLSDVEIRRIELEAQKAFLERVIVLSQGRAQRLQADLSVARTQRAEVVQRQKAAQDQTQALQIEKRAAQVQLRELQQQVQQLQRQAESGLPAQK